MNLLFDFITASIKEGSGEYQRSVFLTLMDRLNSEGRTDVNLFGLYNSNKGIIYEDLRPSSIASVFPRIPVVFIDCANYNIAAIISDYHIDCFFVCCHAYFSNMKDICKLKCKVVCTMHDIGHEEYYNEKLGIYSILIRPGMCGEPAKLQRLRHLRKIPAINRLLNTIDRFTIYYIKGGGNKQYCSNPGKLFSDLYQNNPATRIITVSDCSRNALVYYYGFNKTDIQVLYPPERKYNLSKHYTDPQLNKLLLSGKKYYLMVSADRDNKNPYKAVNAFKRFAEYKPDVYLVTIGFKYGGMFKNHISLSFLSDSDLQLAISNCYALLYPSLFEGFGYPPIEAMKYGKPVLSSNATSMPEILGDAPIYFCPLYESAIFSALLKLTDDNYQYYADKSSTRYNLVHQRQIQDLHTLVSILIA